MVQCVTFGINATMEISFFKNGLNANFCSFLQEFLPYLQVSFRYNQRISQYKIPVRSIKKPLSGLFMLENRDPDRAYNFFEVQLIFPCRKQIVLSGRIIPVL